MNVDANEVINKLGNQIAEFAKTIAMKDVYIEMLQKEVATLSTKDYVK